MSHVSLVHYLLHDICFCLRYICTFYKNENIVSRQRKTHKTVNDGGSATGVTKLSVRVYGTYGSYVRYCSLVLLKVVVMLSNIRAPVSRSLASCRFQPLTNRKCWIFWSSAKTRSRPESRSVSTPRCPRVSRLSYSTRPRCDIAVGVAVMGIAFLGQKIFRDIIWPISIHSHQQVPSIFIVNDAELSQTPNSTVLTCAI